jgi:hypothetical protein
VIPCDRDRNDGRGGVGMVGIRSSAYWIWHGGGMRAVEGRPVAANGRKGNFFYIYLFYYDFRKINGRIKISTNIHLTSYPTVAGSYSRSPTALSLCCRGERQQDSTSGGRATRQGPFSTDFK